MRHLTYRIALVLVLACGLLPVSAQAATYYVATTGSNAAAGSIGAPWLTISYGVAQLVAGDTLYIRAGTYTGATNVIDSATYTVRGGTAGNTITISGYPSETVTLRPPNTTAAIRLTTATQTYLVFQDFILDGVNNVTDVQQALAYLDSGPYNTFLRMEVKNSINFGIMTSINNANPHHTTIKDCLIHDNGDPSGAQTNGHGIYSESSSNLIEGNTFYNNQGYGIHLNGVNPTDNDNTIIRKNRVYNNGARAATSAYGISVMRGADVLVDSNLVYQTDSRTNLGGILAYTLSANLQIFNNTVHGHGWDGIALEFYLSAPVVKNNISYNNLTNIVDHGGTGTPVQSNNLTTNPSFTNAGAGDFTLLVGSVAIDAGATLAAVTTDFTGTARPQGAAYDIGAYESGADPGPIAAVSGAHTIAFGTTGATVTTPGIDTTGATAIIGVLAGDYANSADVNAVINDSRGNTWSYLPISFIDIASYGPFARLVYTIPTSVGAAHTFSASSGYGMCLAVQAFTGVLSVSPVDQQNSATGTGTTLLLGSVTPAHANELIVTGLAQAAEAGGPSTINSGFTLTDSTTNPGNAYSCSLAYKIQTTAAAVAPTWTYTTSAAGLAGRIASFQATSAEPVSNSTHTLCASGCDYTLSQLQTAINASVLGDTIAIAAGSTITGSFLLPLKTGSTYLTITTSGTLPATGVRVTAADAAQMPKIQSTNSDPVFYTDTGAGPHHYKFKGLEITTTSDTTGDLMRLGDGSSAQDTLAEVPSYFIVDQCYFHGENVATGTKRGISLNSASTDITNSRFSNFKRTGQDAQAVNGWNGPGPYLLDNNYFEGSGENVMFGGSDPSIPNLIPSDIIVRRNYFSKPIAWMTGLQYDVKNIFELKNAQRVTVTRNIFDNHWADAQPGYSLVITPRNQNGTAPWSTVRDVAYSYNLIRNVSSVFNILGTDDEQTSGVTTNISITNNLATGVSAATYGGAGRFALVSGGVDITFDHNTSFNDGSTSLYAGAVMTNFHFTNSILPWNTYGVFGDGSSPGQPSITAYFPSSTFTKNVFWGPDQSAMPAVNYNAATLAAIGFVDSASDYHLTGGSAYHAAGTDGLDLGVNYTALLTAIAGVENGDAEAPAVVTYPVRVRFRP